LAFVLPILLSCHSLQPMLLSSTGAKLQKQKKHFLFLPLLAQSLKPRHLLLQNLKEPAETKFKTGGGGSFVNLTNVGVDACEMGQESRRLTAYHEGGHAIVASLTPDALPVHKATVVPRGQSLGMVMQLPSADETSWSKRQMLAKMDVCMGGRVAEEIIYGTDNVTSGASSDFEQATQLATRMVERWGMSEKVGFVTHRNLTGQGGEAHVSQHTREAIDAEVKRLTGQAYNNAKKLLLENEDKLHKLAGELIKEETLTGDQVREIIGVKNASAKKTQESQSSADAAKSQPPPAEGGPQPKRSWFRSK
jgi:ATP-dependent metalloprotease